MSDIAYLYAFIDSGNQPAKQATVEIFGKGISGIVGLWMKTLLMMKRQ